MVAIAAAVVTVIACGCVSAWMLSGRIDDRATARGFREVAAGAPAAFERSALYDETTDGHQIYVYWWRMVDPTARIPGVEANPSVGSWFVSPALADRMADEPRLADRYPGAELLASAGVAHRGELLAYRFVGADVVLSERLSEHAGDWTGDGTEALDLFPISVAALTLIGIPGVGLLIAAMRPFAGALERRLLLLRALGASPRSELAMVCVHTAACTMPGVVAATSGWFLVSPRLTNVPLVGRSVFRGDLGLPLTVAVAVAACVVALAIGVAVLRPGRAGANRPTDHLPRRPTLIRAVPLLTGLVVMAGGTALPGKDGARLFVVGVMASTLGAVVSLPYLIDRAGSRLAARPATLALLVGRRMRWNAVGSTRSLVAVGALVPVVAAWVAVARSVDAPTGDRTFVELRGDVPSGDLAALLERTEAIPLQVAFEVDAEGDAPPRAVLIGDCAALAAHLAMARCGSDGFALAATDELGLGGAGDVEGVPALRPGDEVQSTLFVSDDARATEDVLRAYVLNTSHAGMQVGAPGRAVFHESPLVRWILGAATLAGLVGAFALGLHLTGQAADMARSRIRLLALGADLAVIRRLAGTEAALSVALVGLGCAAVGSISSWMFVQLDGTASVPYAVIALVVAAIAAAAGASGLAAGASVSGRPFARDRSRR